MIGGRPQDDTREAPEFKSADLGKHIEPVLGIRMVHIHRLLHDLYLMDESFVRNICPASRDFDGIPVIEGPQDAGR